MFLFDIGPGQYWTSIRKEGQYLPLECDGFNGTLDVGDDRWWWGPSTIILPAGPELEGSSAVRSNNGWWWALDLLPPSSCFSIFLLSSYPQSCIHLWFFSFQYIALSSCQHHPIMYFGATISSAEVFYLWRGKLWWLLVHVRRFITHIWLTL